MPTPDNATQYTLASDLYPPQSRVPSPDAPPLRLYLGRRELTPADLGEAVPVDPARAEVLLRALLAGQPPGTTGRVDVLAYPTRRGAHAYAASVRLVATAHGDVRPAIACGTGRCVCCDGAPVAMATAGE